MNLYELLGVSQSASASEIKGAYRKLAHKYHPDRPTGDAETFQQLKAAYDVLIDEEKRAHYDRTGEVENKDKVDYEASATQTLKNLFGFAINDGTPNVLAYSMHHLQGSIKASILTIDAEQKLAKRLNKFRNRLVKRNGGPNLFSEVLAEKIKQAMTNIAGMQAGKKITERALEMLTDYEHKEPEEDTENNFRLGGRRMGEGGFSRLRSLFAVFTIAAILLFTCQFTKAEGYSYYVKIGTGYKIDEPTSSVMTIQGKETTVYYDMGSPISARLEAGVEKGPWTFGVSHHSQWLQGWPVNETGEYYKTEIFVDYKFTFGGD